MYTVETMDKWLKYADRLREKGYKLFQMQYNWDLLEGFHAVFWRSGAEDVEIVTHSKQVQTEIIKFETK